MLTFFPFELVVVLFSKWLPASSFFLVALHCIASSAPCNCGLMLALYAFYLNASCGVFLKFMHLHRCISSRYARCVELKDKDGAEPEDGVLVDASRRWTDGS